MYQGSPLFRAASTVIPLLPYKATFTPSIQPNLGLPRTRPPLTSAINTLLAIRYSSILSTCPNHLNILSDPFYSLTPFYSSSPTYLFIPNSIHSRHSDQTSSHEHLLSFSQHFSYPMPLLRTTPLVQLLLRIDTSWPLSPILYCLGHFSGLPKPTPLIYSVHHIPFTSSIGCHLRPPGT